MAISARSDVLRSTYETQLEKTATELEQLPSEELEKIDLSIPYQTALEKSTTMLKSPYQLWETVSTAEKHNLFFFVFEEKLPYSKTEGYRTEEIPSGVKLFEEFGTPTTQHVDLRRFELLTFALQKRCSTN